ncbi:hypothetical protein NECAME_02256 [Necator americanus]|uniref:Uncharacterized protein n=1 Tax=Necator americanus TaxID=51031 RepID=W2TIL7_NECAM|nr:hypothetical protein NECAME_02256 [Necator americanus]ETN80857.1 hypothetical protein NECAME_02256 [Necator americanus]
MSVCGPPPFNGPVSFFEEGHHRSRSPPESHPSDTIRMRFSSSPLPWHRGGAATDYEVWDRAGQFYLFSHQSYQELRDSRNH